MSILSKYIFVHDRRSWNASQAYCQLKGGNLAVITTVEEQKNLMRIIKEKYSWDQAFWVGAKKGEYEVGVKQRDSYPIVNVKFVVTHLRPHRRFATV